MLSITEPRNAVGPRMFLRCVQSGHGRMSDNHAPSGYAAISPPWHSSRPSCRFASYAPGQRERLLGLAIAAILAAEVAHGLGHSLTVRVIHAQLHVGQPRAALRTTSPQELEAGWKVPQSEQLPRGGRQANDEAREQLQRASTRRSALGVRGSAPSALTYRTCRSALSIG